MRLAVIAAVVASTQLSGCFFVFIPGSLIKAAGDAITGAKGEHCVSAGSKAGDTIAGPDGRQYVVRSVSGSSVYCTNPTYPVRAELAPST